MPRDEHTEDRVEEQRQRYRELLEEMRTIIPGAQVLLAFLLTAPFSSRFAEVDRLGKIVFTTSLTAVAAATFLFIAPPAYHRVADRRSRRSRLRFGVRTALAGLLLLGLSVSCAVFVVVRFLFSNTPLAIGFAAAAALLSSILWAVIPLVADRRAGDRA